MKRSQLAHDLELVPDLTVYLTLGHNVIWPMTQTHIEKMKTFFTKKHFSLICDLTEKHDGNFLTHSIPRINKYFNLFSPNLVNIFT